MKNNRSVITEGAGDFISFICIKEKEREKAKKMNKSNHLQKTINICI